MATHKGSEPNATTPQEPSMPVPQPLPEVPRELTVEQRQKRCLRNLARLTRGMANTAPLRGDSLGPLWHELASDLEALIREMRIVDDAPPATPERPLELRPQPAGVIPMALLQPTSTDLLLQELLAELRKRPS